MSALLRLDGVEQLIVCSTDGEIRGYIPAAKELRGQLMDVSLETENISRIESKETPAVTRNKELRAERESNFKLELSCLSDTFCDTIVLVVLCINFNTF